jgi:dTDP-4-dehydrorhamnose reductase
MKILVLGATGMAGHTIATYFKEKGHEVLSFSRTPFLYCNNIICDVLDAEKFKEVLLKGQYNAVINCIGVLNQEAESNPSLAVYLNSYLPHLIANILKDTSTKLIHMSTDCVFGGNTGPYFENSFCDGKTFYDRSKALGELVDNKNLTFRNSIIGPDMSPQGIGLLNWFLQQKGTVNGYTGAIWTGVTTLTLAKAMEKAIEDNLSGLYNLVNNSSISKHDLLHLFNKYFKENEIKIEKQESFKLDKTLRNTREDFLFYVPSYEQMISEMKEWVDSHPNYYTHYKLKK